MESLSVDTRGVIPIVPTPFTESGDIDLTSVPSLVDYYECAGVVGLTILGVMGEATKLTQKETEEVVRAFLTAARGRLPVIIGVSGPSLAASCELGLWGVQQGAAGVMLQPMSGLNGDDAVFSYFESYAARTDGKVPICVQDYPTASGVHLSVPAWERIANLSAVFMLKHEPPAGLQKLSQIRQREREGTCRRVSILTSNNALHLPQELGRGADGAMVGVAFSDLIVRICQLYRDGTAGLAFDIYDAVLPVIRHESQGAFGLAARKEMLRRRGALKANILRYPGSKLSTLDLEELSQLTARLERRLAEIGDPALKGWLAQRR